MTIEFNKIVNAFTIKYETQEPIRYVGAQIRVVPDPISNTILLLIYHMGELQKLKLNLTTDTVKVSGAVVSGASTAVTAAAALDAVFPNAGQSAITTELANRVKAEMAIGIDQRYVKSAYDDLPYLVKKEAGMLMIPSHYKAGKLYGMQPRPQKNLLQYSERFEVAPIWGKGTNTNIASNQAAAPDGSQTADMITFTADASTADIAQVINTVAGASYTFSIYLKAGTATSVQLYMIDPNTSLNVAVDANFVMDGTWKRATITGIAKTNKTNFRLRCGGAMDNKTFYVWGAQVEKGSVATAYQATNASENLLKYSEQFDNAAWGKLNSTVASNSVVAPDGSMTADVVTVSNPSTFYINQPTGAVSVGSTCTASIWLRGSGQVAFEFKRGDALTYEGASNLLTLSSTWTRYTITVSFTIAHTSSEINVHQQASANCSSFEVWGAQLNYGSTALPYTKTTYSNTDGWVNHSDFDFSRSSNATVVGSDGLIQYAPHNLIPRSEEFDHVVWAKPLDGNGTVGTGVVPIVTPNYAVAPDGTLTADRIQFDLGSGYQVANSANRSGISQSVTVNNGTNYVASIYVKPLNGTSLSQLQNMNIGVLAAGTTLPVVVQQLTDGWYRFSFVASTTAGSGTFRVQATSQTTNTSQTLDILVWGAQLNAGSRLLDYVQTTSAALYAPRFQFDPVTKQYQGLLMEKASTNLLLQSEDFNTGWSSSNANVTTNVTSAPDGNTTADKIIETAVSGGHNRFQQYTGATGVYTWSAFIKAAERTKCVIAMSDAATGDAAIQIDLTTGTLSNPGFSVGSWTGISSGVQYYGNGWYRVYVTGTRGAGTATACRVSLLDNTGATTYTGNGTSGLYVWGAQLEQSSVPTSYIPTLGASATRAADVCYNANISNWFNSDETTIWTDVSKATINSDDTIVSVGFGSGESYFLRKRANNDYLLGLRPSGSNFDTISNQVYAGGSLRLAGALKLNDGAFSVKGTLTPVVTFNKLLSSTDPGVTIGALPINNATSGCFIVKTIAFFPTRRTNAELQTITS